MSERVGRHPLWRRREAPPPSWMDSWRPRRQQTQQKHMQMCAKHALACTLYGQRLIHMGIMVSWQAHPAAASPGQGGVGSLPFSLPLPSCRKPYRYRLAASGNYKRSWILGGCASKLPSFKPRSFLQPSLRRQRQMFSNMQAATKQY